MAWADALIMIGEVRDARPIATLAQSAGKPVLKARLIADKSAATKFDGRPVYAFAGIARPEKFFETLAAAGAVVTGTRSFPDHYPYSSQDCRALESAAASRKARLVTTEKDAMRLPKTFAFDVLPVSLSFVDESQLRQILLSAIRRART